MERLKTMPTYEKIDPWTYGNYLPCTFSDKLTLQLGRCEILKIF